MKRKQIALFFIEDAKSGTSVESLKDLKAWLKSFPELGVIASVTPFFVTLKNQSTTSPDFWEKLGQEIQGVWKDFDGFVVFHPTESTALTGSALSYMFASGKKPIVFTGSPTTSLRQEKQNGSKNDLPPSQWIDLASRANIMNAAQVAIMDLPEVVILSGNRLIRANRAERSLPQSPHAFETDEGGLLGRIDFSIHLFERKTQKKRFHVPRSLELEKQIAVVDLYPGFDFSLLPILTHGKKGVIVQSNDAKAVTEALKRLPQDIPVILHARQDAWPKDVDSSQVIFSQVMSLETALTKLMWALGQKRSNKKSVQKIFENDIAGEYNKKEGRV